MTDSEEEETNHALIQAVRAGKVRLVTSLLESSIDVDAQDRTGRTALMVAVEVSKEDVRSHIVRSLLKKQANVSCQDERGMTALMYACAKLGRDDVVRQIVRSQRCEPNSQDIDGNNALIHAVYSGNAPAIRIIVNSSFTKTKLDVDLRNGSGMTALFLAFKLQQSECCRVLVKEGKADTGVIQDKQGLYRILNGESFMNPVLQRKSMSENRAAPMSLAKPLPMHFPNISINSSNNNEDKNTAFLTQKKKKRRHKKKKQREIGLETDEERDVVTHFPPKTLAPLVARKQLIPPSIRSEKDPVMRRGRVQATKLHKTPSGSDNTPDFASDLETDSVTGSNNFRAHPVLGPIGCTRKVEEENNSGSGLLPAIPAGRNSLVANSSMQDDDRATTL